MDNSIDSQVLLVLQEATKLIDKSRKATNKQHFEDARDRSLTLPVSIIDF
jgi:hypothetical protein